MPHTVNEWIEHAINEFERHSVYFGHGTDNAFDEAVQLVLQALNLSLFEAIPEQRVVSSEEGARIQALIDARMKTNKPLPYLTQQAWFMGLPFYVDERVLIPRSPFGEWIAAQFEPWIAAAKVNRILEIGTGSGCMAIAAALVFENAQVDAVDISADALAVAKINVAKHHVQDRVHLIHGDCYAALKPQHQYDIIMSNPPYVDWEEHAELPAEYHHEPTQALFTDDHGLMIVKNILRRAYDFLSPHGILIVEVGNNYERLSEEYPQAPFIWLEQAFGGHGLFLLTREDLKHDWQ